MSTWGLCLLGSPLEPEQRFKDFKEGMERAGRWRDTRLVCCLSPRKVLPVNEGLSQLQPFLSFEPATPGTTLSHGACSRVIRKLSPCSQPHISGPGTRTGSNVLWLGVWPCFCQHLHCRLSDKDCLVHQKRLHSSCCPCFNTNTCSTD